MKMKKRPWVNDIVSVLRPWENYPSYSILPGDRMKSHFVNSSISESDYYDNGYGIVHTCTIGYNIWYRHYHFEVRFLETKNGFDKNRVSIRIQSKKNTNVSYNESLLPHVYVKTSHVLTSLQRLIKHVRKFEQKRSES